MHHPRVEDVTRIEIGVGSWIPDERVAVVFRLRRRGDVAAQRRVIGEDGGDVVSRVDAGEDDGRVVEESREGFRLREGAFGCRRVPRESRGVEVEEEDGEGRRQMRRRRRRKRRRKRNKRGRSSEG